MTIKKIFTEPWPRIIGIPILGAFLCTVFNEPPYTIDKLSISVLITAFMWQGDYMIIIFFRKRWPKLQDTQIRILTTIACVAVYNSVMDYTLCSTLNSLTSWKYDVLESGAGFYILKNLGITFIVGTLYEAGYFFERWRIQTVETEEIKNRQLRTELDVLKSQLSPHFLFNSLNTLIALIHENPQQAAKFTEKLSNVYRYTLAHRDREVVRLSTELEFAEAYFYLLKMRFEEGLQLKIDVPLECKSMYIAPLTIQLLMENVVKHNILSVHKPLHIDIYCENGLNIIVRNNYQPRSTPSESTNLGLSNIKKRYMHLSNREVDIIRSCEYFMVAIPLIAVESTNHILID